MEIQTGEYSGILSKDGGVFWDIAQRRGSIPGYCPKNFKQILLHYIRLMGEYNIYNL